MNVSTFLQASAISNAISSRPNQSAPGPTAGISNLTGLAAGSPGQAWNVWGSHTFTATNLSFTNPVGGAARTDSDTGTTVIGGDFALSPKMTLGVSAAFDRTKSVSLLAATSLDGYSLAPYVAYQLSKELALDVSAGFGSGKYDSGVGLVDVDRWFAAANLSHSNWIGNIQLTGKISYLHGEEKYAALTPVGGAVTIPSATNKMDQIRAGLRAGYWMNGFMPYAGITYSTDIRRASSLPVAVDPLGRRAYVLSVGADFFSLASKVTGGVSYERDFSRTNFTNDIFLANINMRF